MRLRAIRLLVLAILEARAPDFGWACAIAVSEPTGFSNRAENA